MSATVDTLFAQALALPEDTRLELVERLIPTLHSTPEEVDSHLSLIARRIEEVRSGTVQLVSGEDAFFQVQQSLAARRSA